MATAISAMTALASIASGDHFPVVDVSDTTQAVSGTTKRTTFATLAAAVIASDGELAALAGLTSAADRLPYFTGSGAASLATFTAGGRALVNSAGTSGTFPYFSALNTVTLGTLSAAGLALLDDADASAQRTTLGLAIGTNVQAYSANLDEYAAVNPTAAGLALLDDLDAAAQMTTLGFSANSQSLVTAANYAAMKTLLSLDSVENTALSTWSGSANVTTLGTIGTGTWNATAIGVSKGGTGQTGLGTALQVLRTNAAATGTEWATISGGSGDVATDAIWDAAGDLAVGSGANTAVRLAKGTDGQVLGVVAGSVAWTTLAGGGDVTKVGTPTAGRLGWWTGDGTLGDDANLSFNTTGDLLTVGAGSLTRAGAHALTMTTSGTTNVTFPTSGTLLSDAAAVTVAQGGTGRATSTTAYGLIAAGTTATGAHQTLAAGATTEILVGGGASALPVWTTATGSGAPVRGTSPTIATPTFSGLLTMGDGAQVISPNAMGALAIDVTKRLNTKSISADSTFTFSATATSGAWFAMLVTNSDTAAHTLTIPSSYSMARAATVTTVVIPASGVMLLDWRYDGTTYRLWANDGYLSKFDATAAPTANEDLADGYGPGSLLLDSTNNIAYLNESSGAAAAVWHEFLMRTATQTVTGKTVNLSNNTLTGTAAEFNTALSDANFYTTGGTDVSVADGGTGLSTITSGYLMTGAGTSAVVPIAGYAAEATVASATTTDIGAAASLNVSITGTTTITGLGTVVAGTHRYCRFTGALTLTHNATSLILPGGANITTAAGDRMLAESLGSGNWVVLFYQKADGTAVVGGAGGGDVSKVGTPANNQMAVWTGDGTLEGTSDFTYDGTSLNLITGKNFQIAGGTVLADAAGTLTLSGIDALDATTENTIEAAIDTLANLTSVQGHTVTLTGAFIRSGAHSLTLTTTGTTDVTLPTTGTLGLAAQTQGKHMIPVMAGGMTPSASGGCAALATVASAANQPDIVSLDFDATTEEYAQFSIPMPESWNEGTITFQPIWSHASTTTNFGVVWSLQAVAVSDDDAIAVAYGTAVTSTDTGGTTNDIYVGPESSAMTVAGSPANKDTLFFRIFRTPANGSDTMAIDARLHGVRLYFTTNADTDA